MEEDVMMPLDKFLKVHGFDEEVLNDKEKLKVLKQIIFSAGVEKDLEEMRYTKNKGIETREEYVDKINNLDLIQIQAQGYIFMINSIKKEERKLKRKQSFQKVIGVFKEKK